MAAHPLPAPRCLHLQHLEPEEPPLPPQLAALFQPPPHTARTPAPRSTSGAQRVARAMHLVLQLRERTAQRAGAEELAAIERRIETSLRELAGLQA